ncbi:MAG: hypothetical protein IPP35_04565 [Elusimicrobia bacterium]|nr:hypothetical protein [Elusimicrobiota bacterium]
MRVRWSLVAAVTAAFAVGAAASGLVRSFKNGMYYSSVTEEEQFHFDERDDSMRFSQYRNVAYVPPEYGKLIGITGGPGGTLFWYEDAAGIVRNIPVDSQRLLAVKREGRRSS